MAFLQTLYQSAAETLANYDPKKGLVILMDASERFWVLIVYQAELVNIRKRDIRLLHPKSMIYLSGEFNGSQFRWHITQKRYIH